MGILGWFGKGSGGSHRAEGTRTGARVTVQEVGEFLRNFPIGSRASYIPEFQRNIKLDTVILACMVNQRGVYSSHAIQIQQGSSGPNLLVEQEGTLRPAEPFEHFRFVVPFATRSEVDFAHPARGRGAQAAEKPVNDFQRGNSITLFNKGTSGKVPHLDTVVSRVVQLKDGYYANRRVVLLEPEPGSLRFHDQRQYQRVYTRVPATVAKNPDGEPVGCYIEDFSEKFVRLGFAGAVSDVPLREGDRVILVTECPGRGYVMRGAVHRVGKDHLVLSLQALLRDHRFTSLDLIDEFEFKTSLLHHPATRERIARLTSL